jgi:hypothetical protein
MSRSTQRANPSFSIRPLMIDKRKPGLASGGACIIRYLPSCKDDTQHQRNLSIRIQASRDTDQAEGGVETEE